MPIIDLPDQYGHTMKVIHYNGGYASPQFSEEAMNNMRDFPLREDDVVLCSFPKSGCHWVWEILRILVTGKLRDDTLHKHEYMMEWAPYSKYEKLPGPRILNNHIFFHEMPSDLLKKKPKVVFYYRNPKDVVVSFFYHHRGISEYGYDGDFQGYLHRIKDGLVDGGNQFEYLKGWEKGISENPDLPVFVGSYEDLKTDNFNEVKKMAKFLGKDYSDEFIQQVCDATNFDNMKAAKGETDLKNKDGKPVFYRKGQVGDWQRHFNEEHAWFDDAIKEQMEGSKLFNFRYTI